MKKLNLIFITIVCLTISVCSNVCFGDVSINPPLSPAKLIFIHHSVGEGWLSDENGGLARELGMNNYFVSDTYYGWGPDGIGDRTDIPDWMEWFSSPANSKIMQALYSESDDDAAGWDYYNRPFSDPGGQNEVIIFKSCFPNSNLAGNPDDPPGSEPALTVSGAKYVYNQILQYFTAHPEKLFIAITPPPDSDSNTAQAARAFSEWMVKDWLKGYQGSNVGVFDLHAVLSHPENHHRVTNGVIAYVNSYGDGTCAYPTEDAHPNQEGNTKATDEFVPLLNLYYHQWATSKPAPITSDNLNLLSQPPSSLEPEEQSGITSSEISAPGPAETTTQSGEEEVQSGGEWALYSDDSSVIRNVTESMNAGALDEGMCAHISVVPEGWASIEKLFDNPADWSMYQSITFRVSTDNPDAEFRVALYSGTGHDDKKAVYSDIPGVSGSDGVTVTIPLSEFIAEDDSSPLDEESVIGYYFAFGGDVSGTWCFDNIHPE